MSHATQTAGPCPPAPVPDEVIQIRGARVHNLKNIDLDIPRDQLVVITGPSGSGKSSLALDTVFAEGQRQYIETLSVYARQFFHQLERPDVDWIDGLEPTVCIDQRRGNQNPRSTVATVTEIYDYLRILLARLGQAHCYQCGAAIEQQTREQILERLLELPEGTKAMILAPMVRGRRGAHRDVLAKVRKAGMVRVRVDGRIYDLDEVPELAPRRNHDIDAVVDRIVVRGGIRSRLAESLDLAIRYGEGVVMVCYLDDERDSGPSNDGPHWRDLLFSTQYACPRCSLSYAELEPRTFSFNSPYGVCPECEGLGVKESFDPALVIPDPERPFADGAIAPSQALSAARRREFRAAIERFLHGRRADWSMAPAQLTRATRAALLDGERKQGGFPGLLIMLEQQWATATHPARLARLEEFRNAIPCPACHGSRLRPEANSVLLGGQSIGQITALTVRQARDFLLGLPFATRERAIAEPLVDEIAHRLQFLDHVGVSYLTLDRPADTLSGGELQRVRLATSVGAGLVGVCYVLDEPSIGLHPRDSQRLIDILYRLRDQGNTVLVVEHDELMMRRADHLIDFGPGAGQAGGRIVAQGSAESLCRQPQSITARYLAGVQQIPVPTRRRRVAKSRSLVLEGVQTNNLRSVTAVFPLQTMVCVTGVSGSGKSSLVNESLAPALIRRLGGAAPKPGPFRRLRGASQLDKVIQIDQSPIGRTPRSNPATYVGVFDEIRKVFADTRDARQRGYRSRRFSFNVKGGRCETCQGQGVTKIEMNFLPDLYVTCSDCRGRRFNRQTLAVRYRDRTIADVLDMSVEEAARFFQNIPSIARTLDSLQAVGLGYLHLGQPSTTLSGGEAQRVKLATELARPATGKTLYLLDEPTTGLHFEDVRRLLAVLSRLVDRGNTVIVIEHHLDVMKTADWIIDLGPEGGEQGGQIIGSGPPETIAALPDSHTARFLRNLLD